MTVDLTSITLDNGASVALPYVAPKKVLILGDSITEGYLSVGPNASFSADTDSSDSTLSYAEQLGTLLGAEVGVVGFGGQGYGNGGQGSVPVFGSTYNFIYSVASRSFSGIDLVVINMGTNDGSSNTTAAITTVLNGLASAGCGGTIILLEPFSSTVGPQQRPFILAGIAAATTPGQSVELDTTGFFNSTISSDVTHPYGSASIGTIAPRLAAVIFPYLYKTNSGWYKFP